MIKYLRFFILYFLMNISCCLKLGDLEPVDPDFSKNVTELISSYGYPVEDYHVKTKDGYLLSIQRIPYGRSESGTTEKRPVVLLIHGTSGSSACYVVNFPEQSLGFILADHGYDVWMGNTRGNIYSRRHVRMSPEEIEFWDFSLDEKSSMDLPAIIDFILEKTGQKSLAYVGHSQGATLAFALLSSIPEYNKKINLFAAYAPVVFSTHIRGLMGLSTDILIFLQPIYKKIGYVKFLTHTKLQEQFSRFVCGTSLRFICKFLFDITFGWDEKHLNETRLPVFFNQYPAGESIKVGMHYSQMKYSGKFQMFDYRERNMEVYNQITPPEYDLSKITAPVAIFSGKNDMVSNPKDIEKLLKNLNSLIEYYIIPNPKSTHSNYIFGTQAYSNIHKKLLSLLEKYSKN